MTEIGAWGWIAFLMVSSLTLLLLLLASRPHGRIEARLRELSGRSSGAAEMEAVAHLARSALPKMGTALLPRDEEERSRLQSRLLHAGLYGRQAMVFYLGVKMLAMVGPLFLSILVALLGLAPLQNAIVVGALLGVFGIIAPSFWLDRRKAARQTQFRRAIPDALDVLVICLEGGLSLLGGFRRVVSELRTAHPTLARELNIVQREIQMGRSTGEAMRSFGERADLEEIRSLASVITQTERLGASLVKALRVHAETLRVKRLTYAEEMAQKAAIKLLFPTLLLIFPGLFIVILGPAVIQLAGMFQKLNP
jgi:tight adherence protein C